MKVFDEENHSEIWRNTVAKQLNIILGRVQYIEETSQLDETDVEFAWAAKAIVDRVAESEEIEIEPENK